MSKNQNPDEQVLVIITPLDMDPDVLDALLQKEQDWAKNYALNALRG